MVREDGKRNFVRIEDGAETSVFSGNMPRQAALKAARRLEEAYSSEEEAKANAIEVRLREKGTDKIHIFEAWAWTSESPDDAPGWMDDEITKGNVSKKGIEHLDE